MATANCSRDSVVVNEYNHMHDWFASTYLHRKHPLQQILTDPDFDIPSQPAIAARKSASLILSWCSTHHDETAAFLTKLQRQLLTCFTSTAKKMSTRKERMWGLFFTLRSSPSFEAMWKEFLVGCGTDASVTVYQHVTDIIFKDLLSKPVFHLEGGGALGFPPPSDQFPPLKY